MDFTDFKCNLIEKVAKIRIFIPYAKLKYPSFISIFCYFIECFIIIKIKDKITNFILFKLYNKILMFIDKVCIIYPNS